MAIGFLPPECRRQAVYGPGSRKLGYIEFGRSTWFQNEHGQRIARVLRWKTDPPETSASLAASIFPPRDEEFW